VAAEVVGRRRRAAAPAARGSVVRAPIGSPGLGRHGRRRGGAAAAVLPCAAGLALAGLFLWLYFPFVVPSGAPWERADVLALHRAAGPVGWAVSLGIGQLGYPVPIAAVTLLCLAVWLLRGSAWKAAFLLVDTLTLVVLDYGGKALWMRARPALFPHPFVAGSSYPSGHALFAVGYYGLVAHLALLGASRRLRRAGWTLWFLFAAALGVSRLVLGVHWPTDVVAGWAAGAIVLLWDALAVRRWRAGRPGGPFRLG
jgi:undecaprenyl-diphosphatase